MAKKRIIIGIITAAIAISVIGFSVFGESRPSANEISNSSIIIGTYLFDFAALNEENQALAEQNATDTAQSKVYYKSDINKGVWYDITDAENVSDIAISNSRIVDNRVVDSLTLTKYFKADGTVVDFTTGDVVSIQDINNCVYPSNMSELSGLVKQKDIVDSLVDNTSDKDQKKIYKEERSSINSILATISDDTVKNTREIQNGLDNAIKAADDSNKDLIVSLKVKYDNTLDMHCYQIVTDRIDGQIESLGKLNKEAHADLIALLSGILSEVNETMLDLESDISTDTNSASGRKQQELEENAVKAVLEEKTEQVAEFANKIAVLESIANGNVTDTEAAAELTDEMFAENLAEIQDVVTSVLNGTHEYYNTDENNDSGDSTGTDDDTGTGDDTGAGDDTGTGDDTGIGDDTGTDDGTGTDDDTGTGDDTGTDDGTGTDGDTGTGDDTGTDDGTGDETGTGDGTGTDDETGTNDGTGNGDGTDSVPNDTVVITANDVVSSVENDINDSIGFAKDSAFYKTGSTDSDTYNMLLADKLSQLGNLLSALADGENGNDTLTEMLLNTVTSKADSILDDAAVAEALAGNSNSQTNNFVEDMKNRIDDAYDKYLSALEKGETEQANIYKEQMDSLSEELAETRKEVAGQINDLYSDLLKSKTELSNIVSGNTTNNGSETDDEAGTDDSTDDSTGTSDDTGDGTDDNTDSNTANTNSKAVKELKEKIRNDKAQIAAKSPLLSDVDSALLEQLNSALDTLETAAESGSVSQTETAYDDLKNAVSDISEDIIANETKASALTFATAAMAAAGINMDTTEDIAAALNGELSPMEEANSDIAPADTETLNDRLYGYKFVIAEYNIYSNTLSMEKDKKVYVNVKSLAREIGSQLIEADGVYIVKDNNVLIEFSIDSDTAYVGDKAFALTNKPFMINSSVYAPCELIAAGYGFTSTTENSCTYFRREG